MDAFSLLAALEDARETRGSGIPIAWAEVADEVGVHASAFSRLKSGRLPGPKTLRAVLDWLELAPNEFKVIGRTDLPIGGRDEVWDGADATNRVFEWATKPSGDLDEEKLAQAFFFVDPNESAQTRQAYKLPFCDVTNGALHIVPRGMAAVTGGHGVDSIIGASKNDTMAIKRKICRIYERIIEKYDDWPDCPFNSDGTRPERRERRNDMDTNNKSQGFEAEDVEHDSVPKVAAIVGTGSLSKSEDPATQALVARAQELLREGAVAVSIKHDLHPDVSAALAELGPDDAEAAQSLLEDGDIRPRHVAIVDTAAFSNARLKLGEDGFSVSGPVTFEGEYTGDGRTLKYGSLTWDNDLLPIPIIWDAQDGDHSGAVVGYISELERVDGMTTDVRPETVSGEDVKAVVAAAGTSTLPAEYFAQFAASGQTPLTVGAEDENGLRRVFGHAAPFGTCHRSDMGACFQYPKDVDKQLRGFHTGQELSLSDGSKVRVGALTLGGKHLDPNLARQGVGYADTGRHRDDANTIFAVVRAWEDAYGLAVSGVVLPGADAKTLLQAAGSAPSVELWPSGRGRTLVGIHLVPTPAWPVAASAGEDAFKLTSADHVHVDDPEGGFCSECEDSEGFAEEGEPNAPEGEGDEGALERIEASLSRLEKAVALIAAEAMTDIPLPEDDKD